MKKNFFRKVGFGIGPDERVPDNPLSWAQNQVDECSKTLDQIRPESSSSDEAAKVLNKYLIS